MAESRPTNVVQQLIQPPLDEDGRPLVMVRVSTNDLIGLPKFSNLTFFAEAVRWVRDDPDEIRAKFDETFELCEDVLGTRRDHAIAIREMVEGNVPPTAE